MHVERGKSPSIQLLLRSMDVSVRVCLGMYMCKCVCWWAVNLDLKRICVVDVSWATLPTAGLPYLQRAGSLWDLSPDRSYTLYSNALAHISNRKMEKKTFSNNTSTRFTIFGPYGSYMYAFSSTLPCVYMYIRVVVLVRWVLRLNWFSA